MNEKLIKVLEGDVSENTSIPFWSWNNELDEEVLVSQIEDMKAVGIGGFIMHARTGLKTEYLGEKWFSCISACLKKAKELNMKAWIYDENGWPSGFVGGKLLENESFRAKFLECVEGDFDKEAFAVFVKDEKLGYKRINAPFCGEKTYYNVYLRTSPSNTDILNPKVVDAFIKETHEKYYERFKESFGSEMEGFFTDEPQYYRWGTPYSHCAEEFFSKEGEDIRDGLIWLFKKDERGYKFRIKYFNALNELYVENFYKKLYDWCRAHNCKLTGHSVEEPYLFTQMWGGASVSPSYEFEDIPGIDCLGRGYPTELASKQVGSVAAQLGKKYVLTETYACAGYDVTPRTLKGIGEAQYFYGVNKTCQHLYPYSLAGRGKNDHPPVFGRHSNWFEEFKEFNEYFNRLGYLIANTDEVVDIAILHPMRDVWLDYVRAEDYASVADLEESFEELLIYLKKHGVSYHLVDERILRDHGRVDGEVLQVGNCKYTALLLPKMRNVCRSTAKILREYRGKVCRLGNIEYVDGEREAVEIADNLTLEDIVENARINFLAEDGNAFITQRKGELGNFIFLKNTSFSESSKVVFENVAERFVSVNILNFEEKPISNSILLAPNESLILMEDKNARPIEISVEERDVTSNFRLDRITDNYLVLDYAFLSKDGVNYTEKHPTTKLFEDLLEEDYKGVAYVKQEFYLNERMPLKYIVEKAKFLSVKLNGNEISFVQSDFDVNFLESDITEFLREGLNEIVYSFEFFQHDGVRFALFDPLATESLVNCLYYDTSVEPSYLKGDFLVEKDLSLVKRKKLPQLNSSLYENGYPFFKGEISLEGEIFVEKIEDVYLVLEGEFLVANAYINGERVDFILEDNRLIAPLLRLGKNEIRLTVKSSLRNLFGPFHYKNSLNLESFGPYHFEFRKQWAGGNRPAEFTDQYISAPFGIDSIKLITKKLH